MINLIVFLGNKGIAYEKSRHNAGWLLLDATKEITLLGAWQEKFHGRFTTGTWNSTKVHLLKPMTYMNESGKSVGALVRYFSIMPQKILVIHDDIELPFKTVKLQAGGSLAGHNGLRSIASAIGSQQFNRLRIGIGRPVGMSVSSFVLGRFDEMEEAELPLVFHEARSMVSSWLQQGCREQDLPMTLSVGS